MAVLGTVSFLYLYNFRVAQNLESDARTIVASLRDAQERAITREDIATPTEYWALDFINQATGQDYYEVYRSIAGPSKVVAYRRNLSQGIEFSSQMQSIERISFTNGSGFPLQPVPQVILQLISNPTQTKTISVSNLGVITY